MNPADWEKQINALLDGELDAASAEGLEAAAAQDSDLARLIVDAWNLRKNMDQLQLERAPASLRRKLRRIPRQHRLANPRRVRVLPGWVLAGGAAAIVLVAVAMMMGKPAGQAVMNPSSGASLGASDAVRAEQARRELAIAFYYLDKVGLRVEQQIHGVLNDELSAPVKDNLSKHMPYTGRSHKEKRA